MRRPPTTAALMLACWALPGAALAQGAAGALAGGIPAPAAFAMLVLGVGVVGAAVRRQRQG